MKINIKILVSVISCTLMISLTSYDAHGDYLKELLSRPEIRAFLDVIAYAEGTFHERGYSMLYGGQCVSDLMDHPRKVVTRKSRNVRLSSSAAGRYQVLERTWNHFAPMHQIIDFSPESQDKMALILIKQAGALDDILNNQFKKAISKISPIWSSLPGAPYNQPMVSIQELIWFYHERLAYHAK